MKQLTMNEMKHLFYKGDLIKHNQTGEIVKLTCEGEMTDIISTIYLNKKRASILELRNYTVVKPAKRKYIDFNQPFPEGMTEYPDVEKESY